MNAESVSANVEPVGRTLFSGARRGILLGLLVGGVEAVFLSLISWAWRGATNYIPQTGISAAIGMATYATIGAVWGFVAGASSRLVRRRQSAQEAGSWLDCAVTLGLPLAFLVHTTFDEWPTSMKFELPFELSIAASLALVVALCWSRARRALIGWVSPWPIAFALVGTGWLVVDPLLHASTAIQVFAVFGFAFLSGLAARATVRGRPDRRAYSAFPIGALAAIGWFASSVLDEAPNTHPEAREIQRAGTGQPNLLIISLDTTRADHLSAWGYERDTTPNLREFCKVSTRYANAISAADLTLPSHASLFTGLYPRVHGANPDNLQPHGRPLHERFDTLAEMLAQNGFRTIGVVANRGYLGHGFGLDQGFDYYDDRVPVARFPNPPEYSLRKRVVEFLRSRLSERNFEMSHRHADQVIDELLPILDRQHGNGERTFLFANFMDPHAPYDPAPPWDAKFPGKHENLSYPDFQTLTDDVNAGRRELDPRTREHLVSQYDGAIAFLDDELGRLFARMKELGEWDRTMIVVFGDHGESFGDHDRMSHGVSVYQDQVHVPLLIKFAENSEARVVRECVSLVDVLPTVLSALNLAVPSDLPGRSLLRMNAGESRAVFSENIPSGNLAKLGARFQAPQRAVFWQRKKLVQNSDGRFEIYDLADDPDEHKPSEDRAPPDTIRMVDELVRYLKVPSDDSAVAPDAPDATKAKDAKTEPTPEVDDK